MPFRIATYLWLGLTLAFIAAPTAIAVIVAFSVDEVVKFPPDGLSIKWFAIAWRQELFWRSALIIMASQADSRIVVHGTVTCTGHSVELGYFGRLGHDWLK